MSGRKKALAVLLSTIAIFVTAVSVLTIQGHDFFQHIAPETRTVAIIDMARQHILQKEFDQADKLFHQAIQEAQVSADKDSEAFALANYGEFLRKRKRLAEAIPLEERARRLQGIIK